MSDKRRLTIVGHLEELRGRLFVSLLSIGVATAISFLWAGRIIEWLKRPAGLALPKLAFFGPAEAMMAYMKAALLAGICLSFPIVLYELWAFIRPGLTVRERRYGGSFVFWGGLLFFLGAAFAYWVLLPVSLAILLGFGGGTLVPVISVSRYLSFAVVVIATCGMVFELPLAVFFLARLGLLSATTLRRKRRQAVLIIVVATAILTPTTDVATMLLITAPILVLYEASILLARLTARRTKRNA